jgi:hypothetical protein
MKSLLILHRVSQRNSSAVDEKSISPVMTGNVVISQPMALVSATELLEVRNCMQHAPKVSRRDLVSGRRSEARHT